MKPPALIFSLIFTCLLACTAPLLAQQTEPPPPAQENQPAPPPPVPVPVYQPKFPGDPAHSDSEAAALAYMRVVIRAQRQFNKQYDHFAKTLAELVHSGSFTKRMVNPDRGDYTASFKGKDDSYVLTMTPKFMDAQHRSFYAEDDGKIHADETKPADSDSPVVK
ncbi:MAG: hypothetical protein ACLQBK_24785 [Candidatus Sulfotelmatobacter sp.]